MSSSSVLLGKAVYSLQGIASIPANTWTFNYRAWKDGVSTVTYDAESSTTSSGSSSLSWSHTVGNGNNRLLVVTISTSRGGSASAPPTISSITYNNIAMTLGPNNAYASTTNPQVRVVHLLPCKSTHRKPHYPSFPLRYFRQHLRCWRSSVIL